MYDGNPCGRPVLQAVSVGEPSEACLMHSDISNKSDEEFQAEFERILNQAGSGVADFMQFVFPAAHYAGRVFNANCIFRNATFTQDADFSGATFAQDADFWSATFTQDADFSCATFTQDTYFSGATFTLGAFFSAVTFTKGAYFSEAKFTQEAYFNLAKFTQGATFRSATFTQDATFWSATLTQDADFYRATFRMSAKFEKTTFGRAADFREAKFRQNAEFLETKFRQDNELMPGPIFSRTVFSHPEEVVFYKTDLGQALFHNCDVSRLNFSSVTWRPRKHGRRKVLEEEGELDWEYEYFQALVPLADKADDREYRLIAELYQQLKKNYDDRKDYQTAGDFHYGEMEMKRLSSRWRNPIPRWLHRNLGLVAWYKYASRYGESYVWPGFFLVVILLTFALLYPVVGLRYNSGRESNSQSSTTALEPLTYWNPLPSGAGGLRRKAELNLIGNSFLTALDVAAFQKDSTYLPVSPWGHALALLEMLITSALFALFLLAVRRQFRR